MFHSINKPNLSACSEERTHLGRDARTRQTTARTALPTPFHWVVFVKHHAVHVALVALCFCALATGAQSSRLTLTNHAGRELQLAESPARLVVAGRGSFMIVHAATLFPEAKTRLLAAAGGRQLQGDDLDFLIQAGRLSTNLMRLGAEVGPEQLAPLHPDLVLLKSASVRLSDALAKVRIPAFDFDLETPEQYEQELIALGNILGNAQRGADLAAYYRECRTRIASRLSDAPPEQRPRVLLVQASVRGGALSFSVPGVDWMQTRLIQMAGGLPVWQSAATRSGWSVVGLEQAAIWNPDVILVVDYGEGNNEMATRIRDDRTWQRLDAVKRGKVWTFPRDFVSWDQPDPRWALGLMWTAKRLHPDRFTELNLWAEVVTFYRWYGLNEAEVTAQIKPRLRGDWP